MVIDGNLFFSYCHKDNVFLNHKVVDFAQSLVDAYKFSYGHTLKLYIDKSMPWGADWSQWIKDHIKSANIFLAIISPQYLCSDYCYNEFMNFINADVPNNKVLPLKLRDFSNLRDEKKDFLDKIERFQFLSIEDLCTIPDPDYSQFALGYAEKLHDSIVETIKNQSSESHSDTKAREFIQSLAKTYLNEKNNFGNMDGPKQNVSAASTEKVQNNEKSLSTKALALKKFKSELPKGIYLKTIGRGENSLCYSDGSERGIHISASTNYGKFNRQVSSWNVIKQSVIDNPEIQYIVLSVEDLEKNPLFFIFTKEEMSEIVSRRVKDKNGYYHFYIFWDSKLKRYVDNRDGNGRMDMTEYYQAWDKLE